ncbi:Gfo/Idh/MocA family oxidoreductase, partial [Polaribacter sp.]|nr:Gfo/Idh/MocA family oxidoreductase [Polaribacter sp.]
AHYRRNLPAFQKVKALLDENAIGKILSVDIQVMQASNANKNTAIITETEDHWRLQPEISGGGYFNDIAPHQIDLMYYYFGEIKKTVGFSTSIQQKNIADIVNGILEFENGIQFRGVWNFIASENNEKDECTIYGEKGTITFSFFGDEVFLNTNEEKVFKFKNPQHLQQPMIAQTVQYFLGKAQNPCCKNFVVRRV